MAGVVFVNPGSGPDAQDPAELIAAFPNATVEEVEPSELVDRLRASRDGNCEFVGIVGGDGTVRAAAEVMTGSNVPLLVVPGGTRNHFAKELGNCTIDDAAGAHAERRVSVGCVNGKCFVNNASVGLYPALVRRRTRHMRERSRSKRVANVIAAWELLRHGRPVTVELDGQRYPSWLLFVGNGRYGDGFTDVVERDSLEGAVLDIRVLRADARAARLRVAGALMSGRLRRSKLIVAHEAQAATVDVPGLTSVDVALDGELMRLDLPLLFSVEPGALTVLVRETGDAPAEADDPRA